MHARPRRRPHAAAAYKNAICGNCGAGTTYPVPAPDELERAYGDWYRPPSGRFGTFGDRLLARSRASLARRIDRIAPPGPVLDVGAGDGTLVRALRDRGREAAGLERGDPEIGELGGDWAGIVFWHTLEHLRDPAAALEGAVALLAPGGVLLVAVPNLSSWQAEVFGERWFHLDLPRHLVHLPAATLIARLEALGLGVERVSHWRGGQLVFGWLHGLVRPDLYAAIRRPEARERAMTSWERARALLAAAALSPVATLLAGAESAAGRGGTVYVEARRT